MNAELLEREETELLDTVDDVKGFLQSPKYHRDIPKYIERTNVVAGRVAVLKSTQDQICTCTKLYRVYLSVFQNFRCLSKIGLRPIHEL